MEGRTVAFLITILGVTYANAGDTGCSTWCAEGVCDSTSGACTKGCLNSTYGKFCNNSCSPNCVDGLCEEKKAGVVCNRGCVNGYWGTYCQNMCPENCQKCHIYKGACERCNNHTFGRKCTMTCSEGCVNQDCDMSGVCRLGCAQGWMGEHCQFQCVWFLLPGFALLISIAVCVTAWVFYQKWMKEKPRAVDSERLCMETETIIEVKDESVTKKNGLSTPIIPEHRSPEEGLPLLRTDVPGIKSSFSTRVSVREFRQYVQLQTVTGGLTQQFNSLSASPRYTSDQGDQNKSGETIPCDYNRDVHVKEATSPPSDLVNASFIHGYNKKDRFILTEGPKSERTGDFWTLIWQQSVSKIIFFNDKANCEQYWPDMGQSQMVTSDITVECLTETTDADLTVRTFFFTKEGHVTRGLKQYHCTRPDGGSVVDNAASLLNLQATVAKISPLISGPVLVHYSDGDEHAGVFIAVEYLVEQMKTEGVVDVFECVLHLRRQRVTLIQTELQYLLLHEVLRQATDSLTGTSSARTFAVTKN